MEAPEAVTIIDIHLNEGVPEGEGVGTRFMLSAKSYCDATGKQLIASNVSGARGFYESLGWMRYVPARQFASDQFVYDPTGLSTESAARICPTCGDPLGGQFRTFCPRCQWSEMDSNLDSDPLSNPPDPTVDMHKGIQSARKTSDKLHDFLMSPKSRPDLQTPEGQRWLKWLEHEHGVIGPKLDPLTPWLTREWKKGRIMHHEPMPGQNYTPNFVEDGNDRPLVRDLLSHWADFYQSNHPLRGELGDIMTHHVQPFHDQVNAWQQAMIEEAHEKALQSGQVVHTTPDNWTIRRLTTPEECTAEGEAMGHCFLPGTLVRTAVGLRPIEEIAVGEPVLADDGRYHAVTQTFAHQHTGPIYELLLPTSSEPLRVTAEHPFLTDAGWLPARSLAEGSALKLTPFQEERDVKVIRVPEEHLGPGIARWGGRLGPETFDLDTELLWLIGLYLAEGNADGDKIQYSVSKTEEHFARRIEAYFGHAGYRVRRDKRSSTYGGLVLKFNSRRLSQWWRNWLGHGAANKRIPPELMDLPARRVVHLLAGLLDGDGHGNDLRQTSPVLAAQVIELSVRLGGAPMMTVQHQADRRPCYNVYGALGIRPDQRQRYVNDDARIIAVDQRHYSGSVYNLEVADRHTYVVGNVVVHNCVGGYGPAVERGDTLIHSLRDPAGRPHATTEIRPKYLEWRGQRIPIEHLDMNAPVDEGEDAGQPIPEGGEVVQIQGKGNREPIDEHKARLADWFRSFHPDERPTAPHDEDGEPLYDDDGYSHYEIDHPDLIPQYQEQNGGSLADRTEPTEDAYGLLHHPTKRPADYDELLKNIDQREVDWSTTRGDPAHIKSIYLLAQERGEIPELAKALQGYEEDQHDNFQEWLDQNYEYAPRYTDPDDPHGWEDEEGIETEEGQGRAYWKPDPGYGEKYYDPGEAETAYDKAYGEWAGQHGGLDTANEMYKRIQPHYGPHPETGEPGYWNQPAQPTAPPVAPQALSSVSLGKWFDAVEEAP